MVDDELIQLENSPSLIETVIVQNALFVIITVSHPKKNKNYNFVFQVMEREVTEIRETAKNILDIRKLNIFQLR